MKKILFYAGILTLLALLLGAEQQKGLKPRSPNTVTLPTGTPLATMCNINQVAAWYEANGEQERKPTTGNAGLYYPRGTATAI